MTQPYKRPPITEAVIEIRFATPTDVEALAEAFSKFKSLYPHSEKVNKLSVGVTVNPAERSARVETEEVGHKGSTSDQTEILVLWQSSFMISHLTPYPGWEEFLGRFLRDWKLWKREIGYKKISRVGVRFINRIDVPTAEANAVGARVENFLNVYPQLPPMLDENPMVGYSLQTRFLLSDIGCKLTLNSLVVPPPLLEHVSFVVDLDIAKDHDPPQNEEEMVALLNQIRQKKNLVFEACITDPARQLFQR